MWDVISQSLKAYGTGNVLDGKKDHIRKHGYVTLLEQGI